MRTFYDELEGQLAAGLMCFEKLSGFLQEGLSAYRERLAGLAPDARFGSEAYYESLVALRSVSPQSFARSYSSVTSESLDRFIRAREISAARVAA